MENQRGSSVVRFLALLLIVLPVAMAQTPTAAPSDPLGKAEELYKRTDYRGSLTLIHESGRTTAKAYALAGRDHFMLGDYKRASHAFERAFALETANPEYALWLGRSFGRRAETSSPFSAPKYASRARAYLEKAADLDPNNREAMRELFDYYLEAPGFSGKGFAKAEGIEKRIAEQNPAEGTLDAMRLTARLQEFDTASEQLRRVIQSAPREVGRFLGIARSLARQGRLPESAAALDHADDLLSKYIQSNLAPGDPARAEAERLLKEASGL
jgi:tetratricopeptide (TPR) repeat protein